MHQQPFIRLENLSKSYQEGTHTRVVLRDANAVFAKGEFAAIPGRSGTGKSTLLNLISGIDRADSGAIWLDGQNLIALDEQARTLFRRQYIGFVFQFFNLIPTLTVWENVVLPLELKGTVAEEARPRVESMLDAVGLLDRRDAFPDRLSGGEQQRIAIARAFAPQPHLLFADEPTGNLDAATGERVVELLFELNREQGTTLVLVTHDTALTRYCDRTLELSAGRITREVACVN